jgi:hypothetical protein
MTLQRLLDSFLAYLGTGRLSYWLDNRDSIPGRRSNSSLCYRAQFEAHPTSCPVSTGGFPPKGKAATYHLPPSSAEVKNSRNYASTPHTSSWFCAQLNVGQLYPILLSQLI